MEDETLKNRMETSFITKTFNIGYMPIAFWEEIDSFCREYYGNVRWVMLKDLKDKAVADFKFELLYDQLQELKGHLALLEQKIASNKQSMPLMTFGKTSKTLDGEMRNGG